MLMQYNYTGGATGGGVYTVWPGNCATHTSTTITTAPSATIYSCHKVMNLPKNKMPRAVFFNGKMLTMGLLGTNAECAYTGKNLVFAPGVTEGLFFPHNRKIILEYAKEMYHYEVLDTEDTRNKLNVMLLSITKK